MGRVPCPAEVISWRHAVWHSRRHVARHHRLLDTLHRVDRQPSKALSVLLARYCRAPPPPKTELGSLQSLLTARRRAHLTGQADLAERDEAAGRRLAAQRAGVIASITARSAAGSPMRTPPTALTNTSWSKVATTGVAVQHRQQHGQAVALQPHDSAARSRPAGIDQRLHLHQQRPRALQRHQHAGAGHRLAVLAQEDRAGVASTPFRPRSVIANTPISLTAPKRFLMARIRPSCCACRPRSTAPCRRCAPARAGRQRAVLRHVADQHTVVPPPWRCA